MLFVPAAKSFPAIAPTPASVDAAGRNAAGRNAAAAATPARPAGKKRRAPWGAPAPRR